MSAEDKKLEKLNKQYKKVCKDVMTVANSIRTLPYGMDRYRRLYWSLPTFKGLIVESLESSVDMLTSGPSDTQLNLEALKPACLEDSNQALDTKLPEQAEDNSKKDVTEAGYVETKVSSEKKMEDDKSTLVLEEAKTVLVNHKLEPVETSTPEVKPSDLKNSETQSTEPGVIMDTPKLPQRTQSMTQSVTSNSVSVLNGSAATSTHSIASWLNSTIDNIFGASGARTNLANNISSQHTNTGHNLVNVSASQGDAEESWFELNR